MSNSRLLPENSFKSIASARHILSRRKLPICESTLKSLKSTKKKHRTIKENIMLISLSAKHRLQEEEMALSQLNKQSMVYLWFRERECVTSA